MVICFVPHILDVRDVCMKLSMLPFSMCVCETSPRLNSTDDISYSRKAMGEHKTALDIRHLTNKAKKSVCFSVCS